MIERRKQCVEYEQCKPDPTRHSRLNTSRDPFNTPESQLAKQEDASTTRLYTRLLFTWGKGLFFSLGKERERERESSKEGGNSSNSHGKTTRLTREATGTSSSGGKWARKTIRPAKWFGGISLFLSSPSSDSFDSSFFSASLSLFASWEDLGQNNAGLC